MNAPRPKQYLNVAGRPVIEWTLRRILAPDFVAGAVVAIAPEDPFWPASAFNASKPVVAVTGGRERFESVTNGLRHLAHSAGADTWALVHDAVRPCITPEELDRLVAAVSPDRADGALLGLPVRDTLKRAGAGQRVESTVSREHLWQALTPQLFPVRTLLAALEDVVGGETQVTDEAQAMELAGYAPALVPGAITNIKLTQPDDLALIARLLGESQPALP
ncbi:2-C-methyl-D-erythritol 4-phosphate cytidylyltransferase [Ectothiorhodospiraceae bacterium WFHF3C12]|nr:2-C-methyl-D-erythritol 4-phosphate cytidylyltransferase [Ectothiorhodospiraceae bacterium WFHF3C12]